MFKDLMGMQFGRLKVVKQDFENEKANKRTYWICECSCGNIISVASSALLRKDRPTRSCGCIRKENNAKRIGTSCVRNDLVGKKFGRLTVMRKSNQTSGKRKKIMYDCLCECGNYHTVAGEALLSGNTVSCGCYYIETRGTMSKNYCVYDLDSYTYGVGYCENNTKFFFDKEDYERIKDYSWWYDGKYVIAHSLQSDKYTTQLVRLHRVVMDIEDRENINIDHINHITYDCRKSNLRKANNEENAWNQMRCCATLDNPIGIYEKNGKYSVYISKNNMGIYDNFIDAFEARKLLEKNIYKDFLYNPDADKIIEVSL